LRDRICRRVSASHSTSQSFTTDEASTTAGTDAVDKNPPQSSAEYSGVEIDVAVATVAIETPTDTASKLIPRSTTDVDVSNTVAADFTTGLLFYATLKQVLYSGKQHED